MGKTYEINKEKAAEIKEIRKRIKDKKQTEDCTQFS